METKKSTPKKKQTTFEKLSAINVNQYVEKKGNLTYLSWAFAWSETKRNCPDARYEILETTYDEQLGFMCNTQVTIEGETLPMWLPVMDSKNQSMRKTNYKYSTRYGEKEVMAATTFDINKTMMRCLVKNLAMFGMGIYIYAGEDMPTEEVKVIPKKEKAKPKTNSDDKDALMLNSNDWKNVSKFVVESKHLGLKKIIDKVSLKFTLNASVKNEIKNLIK